MAHHPIPVGGKKGPKAPWVPIWEKKEEKEGERRRGKGGEGEEEETQSIFELSDPFLAGDNEYRTLAS